MQWVVACNELHLNFGGWEIQRRHSCGLADTRGNTNHSIHANALHLAHITRVISTISWWQEISQHRLHVLKMRCGSNRTNANPFASILLTVKTTTRAPIQLNVRQNVFHMRHRSGMERFKCWHRTREWHGTMSNTMRDEHPQTRLHERDWATQSSDNNLFHAGLTRDLSKFLWKTLRQNTGTLRKRGIAELFYINACATSETILKQMDARPGFLWSLPRAKNWRDRSRTVERNATRKRSSGTINGCGKRASGACATVREVAMQGICDRDDTGSAGK